MKKAKQTPRITPRKPKPNKRVKNSGAKNIGRKVWRKDLVQLVLEPLAAQIGGARLELLGKIELIEDSAEIMAREMSRQPKANA